MSGKSGIPSRMSRSGWEALPDVLKWSGDPPGRRRVVEKPFRMSGSGERPSRMSERLAQCPGVVEKASWMSGSSRETLPDVREWSGDHPGCPGVVWRPSRMSESGHDALPDVREW